jgi:hypothetical protein
MSQHALALEIAMRLAGVALGHVEREYPNKLDPTLAGPQDVGKIAHANIG